MKHTRKIIVVWLVCGLVSPLFAAPLFEEHSTLEFDLNGPLSSLIKNKNERNEWPFLLRIDATGFDLQVRVRGNSRLRVCDFPPLRLNFNEADTVGTLFEGQGKLKLVARCMKGDRSERDVLEEYAAYRIFSLLSDVSYRVRLVHLNFSDTDDRLNEAYRRSYGFLIEPLEQLVSRVDGSSSELAGVSLRQMDENQAALVYIFQYLIANTDWSFVKPDEDEFCCHNIKLINIGSKQFPVPYDFDLAGLVSAAYARPDPSLKIKKVSKRLYRGFCTDTRTLRGALRRITSREDEILRVIADLPMFEDREKQNRMEYLQAFFEEAREEDKIISVFEKRCHP
jgi:hypothetical protein